MTPSGEHRYWLAQYPEYIKPDIDEITQTSIPAFMQECITEFSTHPAYQHLGTQISYQQLGALVNNFSEQLHNKYSLDKGDRIALMMPNTLAYPVSMFSVLQLGGIVVNVNPLYTPRELKELLQDSGARIIIIMDAFTSTLREIIHETAVEHVIVCRIGDLHRSGKRWLLNSYARHIKQLKQDSDISGAEFHDLACTDAPQLFQPPPIELDDIAFLQYTGGTTGKSKGAMLTHHNIIANAIQATSWIGPAFISKNPHLITALPLYHIFALMANVFAIMRLGGCSHLITNPKDMSSFLKELANTRFHAITGVNTLFNAMLHHKAFKKINFDNLQLTLAGGMSAQQQVADDWFDATGTPIIEAYGLTESSPALCANLVNIKQFTGTIGLPLPSTEISIRNTDGKQLPANAEGEVWARGPQIMLGYWNAPDETEKVLTSDGWLKTGDIGVMSDAGFVRLVDRKKDMIIVSGFNVYPNEVEAILARHPDILEAGVIGVPNEQAGEAVKAVIVKRIRD